MPPKHKPQKKQRRGRGLDAPPTPVSATVESGELPDVATPLSRPASPHPAVSPSSPVTPPASEPIDGVSEQSPVAEAGLAMPPPVGSHDESADGEQGQSQLDQQTEAAAEAEQQPSATAEGTHAEGSHDENAETEHGEAPPDQEAQVTAEPGQQAANGDEEQTPTNTEDGSPVGPIEHESRDAEPVEPEIADAAAESQAAESQEDNEEGDPRTPIASDDSQEQTQSEPQLDAASGEVVAEDQVDQAQEQVETTEDASVAVAMGNPANVHESTDEEDQQELEDSQHELHEPNVNLTPVEPALEDNQLADDGEGRAGEVEQPYEEIVAGEQAQSEETQLPEDARQEPATVDNQEPEDIHGQASAADTQRVDDEAQLDSEEAQEQSDNDQFFDTLEPELDVEDSERTPTQLDQGAAVDQELDHKQEQSEQFDAFKHGYSTQAAEYPEEEDATLYDSPTDTGAYALQIIIEQPEEEAIWSPLPEQEQSDQPSADPQDDSSQRDAFPYGEAYGGDVHDQDTTEEMQRLRAGAIFDISAKDVASRDLLAVADLFANMKSALTTMTSAFDRLGAQTEKMAALGLDVKAAQQLQQIKATLQSQISRHTTEVEILKSSLQTRIKEAVEAKIRDRLQGVIQSSIRAVVEERVREELSVQIPEDLRKQVISHKRQILEVKTSLHNSEARRYNALQTMPDLNAPLRPLLRPLPTPEQSPVVISISRSSSMGYSTLPTPATAFPQGPAPTPIRRSASNPYRSLTAETVPPSPSPFFPRDMTTLFALNPEETKRLLREYGLTSAVASPAAEHPTRARGLSIVNEDAAEEDPDVHARDLNKFMAHIGVPFLMIPAPKEKHHESAPLSSKSRRRLLTPLIIK